MTSVTGLSPSFARLAGLFLHCFLFGPVLRGRLRGILRVAVGHFLKFLDRDLELADLVP